MKQRTATRLANAIQTPGRRVGAFRERIERRMNSTNLVELRQYTLFGNQRDKLIDLFEREFIETQEAAGAQVFGRFIDLDDPDRFVWMRGFRDMSTRGRALAEFYGGPVWAAHRKLANSTMVDSDNVLLLRPLEDPDGVRKDLTIATGLLRITIHSLGNVRPELFSAFWTNTLHPMLVGGGYSPLRPLVSASVENNFPQLPVREDRVFLWFMAFDNEKEERDFSHWWKGGSGWRDKVVPELLPAFMRKPEILRLSPVWNAASRRRAPR